MGVAGVRPLGGNSKTRLKIGMDRNQNFSSASNPVPPKKNFDVDNLSPQISSDTITST